MIDKTAFMAWCTVKRHLSKGSLLHTEIRYDYLIRWLSGMDFSPKNSENFILHLKEKGLRNSSINGYIRILKLIDVFLRGQDIDVNLLKNIDYFPKERKVPTILSVEEIKLIISSPITYTTKAHGMNPARNKYLNETLKLSVWFLAATGCRFNEMASLKVEDLEIGLEYNFAVFKDTKNRDEREVPIPPNLAYELKTYIKEKDPSDLVFLSSKGNKLVEQVFNAYLKAKVRNADINKHIHAHVFRYSYIMEHIKRGTGHLTISKLVGHRDPKTTLGYTRYERDDMIRGAENHPFFTESVKPQNLLEKIAEMLDKLPTKTDFRFKTRTEKTNNSLLLEIAINE